LIRTFEKAKDSEMEILNRYIGVSDVNAEEKVAAIKSLMESLEVDRELIGLSDQYYQQALESLDSLSIRNEYTEELRAFATQLMVREY
jgi:geranylgeranyl diphosphate synthase type II